MGADDHSGSEPAGGQNAMNAGQGSANAAFYNAAVEYAARGWCILPMTAKKSVALGAYKQFQTRRPTAAELAEWFGRAGIAGLGVMCGMVSGGLYCRDFDNAGAYEAWKAAYPALAAVLPTVRTARGYHVYARWGEPVKTAAFDDGELRGEKAFVALPPSRHPSGTVYEWIIPPGGGIPLLSPSEAGLNRCYVTERTETQSNRETEPTEETEKQNGHLSLRLSVSLSHDEAIEAAIVQTLPTRKGMRNDNVFTLARALKAVPTLANADTLELKTIVKDWHGRALPIIGTKAFDATWADFCHAWPRVEYPLGQSPLETIMERLECKAPPPEAAMFETPGIKRLVALCAELQRQAGNMPFYLDCRSAGKCIGEDHNTASRWLGLLVAERLLVRVEQGKPGRATRWRWSSDPKA